MTRADRGPTNPEAGVIATRPATAPEAAPRTVGLPRFSHSVSIQEIVAAAVATWVTTKALVARAPELSALPALKPNQPTHSMAAPVTVNGRLCGGMGSEPKPRRFPIRS